MNPTAVKVLKNSRGQGLTEYIILLLLIAVVSIVATRTLGSTIRSKIQEARNHINSDITLDGSGGGHSSSLGTLGGILRGVGGAGALGKIGGILENAGEASDN